MNVVHVINSLPVGGAELMLYQLLSQMDREQFKPIVVSLMDRGTLGDRIEALDIPVHTINIRAASPTPIDGWRFIHKINQLQPDLIQGWMYHGSFAAQLARITLSTSVCWNIRHSIHSLSHEKSSTALLIKALAKFSHFPAKILYNSRISASQHEQLGYRSEKSLVITNGFDTEIFKPSFEDYIDVRAELGLGEEVFLIGRIGRYHPMKGYSNFLCAAAHILKEYPDLHFMLVGTEVNWDNQVLSNLIYELGIAEQVHLLGERQDIPRLTSALDIAASTSYTEAFPNVVGEAMACGIPCVVTDVGDSAWIVGETGKIVPPEDSEAMANAWKALITMHPSDRQKLGDMARARVVQEFSLKSVVRQYENLYRQMAMKSIK